MTTRLKLYNLALLYAGERALSSLTEAREPRRLLDTVWEADGVNACLEQAQWKFAMRTIQIDYDPDIDPQFGFKRAFSKPTDWLVTSAVASDEFFSSPLLQYADESGYWYSELDTMYVRYVSSDARYGLNMTNWPASFTNFVAAYFCSRIIYKLAASEDKVKFAEGLLKKFKLEAMNRDAMGDPPKFPAPGSWSTSRLRTGSRRDRGNISGDLY